MINVCPLKSYTMSSNRFTEYEQFRESLLTIDHYHAFHRKPTETWAFSDESGTHSGTDFFGIGALLVWHKTASGRRFGSELQEMCSARKWSDEFKWSNLSRGNIHRYRGFVEKFFLAPKTIQFHCILVNRSLLSIGDSQSPETLFKFYHLLFAHRIRPTGAWRSSRRMLLIPDRMDLPDEHWSKLFHSVNASLKRQFDIRHYALVECLPTDSKVCLEIQLADVLLGGIVARGNGNFKSRHKQDLAEELWSRLTGCDKDKASIWKWQPAN
jgi:hypothetical protein